MVDDASHRTSRDINWKLIWIGILVAVLVLFAALNTHDVSVDYVFGTFDTSMIVVIAISAAVGFGLGVLFIRHRNKM